MIDYLLRSALAVACFMAITTAVKYGSPYWAIAVVIVASPTAITILGVIFDERSLAQSVNLGGNSWSYLLGDTFALTAAFAAAAFGWRSIGSGWWTTNWWFVVACVLGLAAGTAFHIVDGAGYRTAGAGVLVDSQSKLWHDLVTYPTLFGGLVWAGVPLLVVARNQIATWVCVAGVALWAGFAVCDSMRQLDPWKMHGPVVRK